MPSHTKAERRKRAASKRLGKTTFGQVPTRTIGGQPEPSIGEAIEARLDIELDRLVTPDAQPTIGPGGLPQFPEGTTPQERADFLRENFGSVTGPPGKAPTGDFLGQITDPSSPLFVESPLTVSEQKKARAIAARQKRGRASTLLTGRGGLTSRATIARRTLLGA